METRTLQELAGIEDLMGAAQLSDEPVIVFDGEDECLVAMRPAVLERILFDSDLLNCEERASMHL